MKIHAGRLLMAVLLFIFSSENSLAAEQVNICGTGDSQELLRILGKRFEADHPEVKINVPNSVGSGGGIRAVAQGKCDLGRVARPVLEKEKHYNLTYRLFAWSPVVFVLHPAMERPQSLTGRQIVDIYSGHVDKWEQVGGDKGRIYIVNREEQDSSRTVLEEHLHGFGGIKTFAGKVFYTTPEAVQGVVNHRQTIGYLPLSTVKNSDLHILVVDGVAPTPGNVRSGAYKLTVPLGLVWKGELAGGVKTFVNFLGSPAAEEIIQANGAFMAISGE